MVSIGRQTGRDVQVILYVPAENAGVHQRDYLSLLVYKSDARVHNAMILRRLFFLSPGLPLLKCPLCGDRKMVPGEYRSGYLGTVEGTRSGCFLLAAGGAVVALRAISD